ncbi:Protein F07C3.3, partial [Aphelenchoides avenae]
MWERFSMKFTNKSHFAFNFFTGLTHASANNVELFDAPLADTLDRLNRSGLFDNTFVIIMGDHGQRISSIQNTYTGRIEERMPMFGMHVPERFRKQHPEKYRKLQENKNRLTSNFDVYETLREIMSLAHPDVLKETTQDAGLSLFKEVPKDRTCRDARIPENFCMCMDKKTFSVKEDVLDKSRSMLSNYLNATFGTTKCVSEWKLHNISEPVVYGISSMARQGARYMVAWQRAVASNGPAYANRQPEIVELEFNATVSARMRKNWKTDGVRNYLD